MRDIVKIIQENVEQDDRNKINFVFAILVAFILIFIPICNVKVGNIVQPMSQAQA